MLCLSSVLEHCPSNAAGDLISRNFDDDDDIEDLEVSSVLSR